MPRPDSPHLLRILEERLLSRSHAAEEPSVGLLLADDFYEIGCSGRLYDKDDTLGRLATESNSRGTIQDFQIRFLAPDVALVVYLLVNPEDEAGGRPSWRSSIWQCHHGRWQLHFHQGTPAARAANDISFLS